ncbi:MAG: TRAM domain-containing protein, partial [Planctomycetaceae bacterium]|nr:TRAM domain-containing protein [Planctomycetaceae bacterium]
NEMLDLQNEISEEDNVTFIGSQQEILVEGLSKTAQKKNAQKQAERQSADHDHDHDRDHHGPVQLTGRTRCDRIVVFEGNPRLIGRMVKTHIEDCTSTTLIGSIVTQEFQHGQGPGSLLPILS